MKDPNAVALGRKGGQVKSEAKTAAVRENGKKGGRPKKLVDKTSRVLYPPVHGRPRRQYPLIPKYALTIQSLTRIESYKL